MSSGRRIAIIAGSVAIVAALAVGAGFAFEREPDPAYDDDKAFAALLASTTVTVPPDVTLPEASGAVAVKPTDPSVVLSKVALRFPLSDLRIELPAEKTHGVDAKYKRDGANGLYVTELGEVLAWAKRKDGQARTAGGQDPTASTLTVLADRTTPYRLLLETLFTATQSDFRHFALAVRRGDRLSAFETPTSKRDVPVRMPTPTQGLTVLVVSEGISMKASGGNVAPGCKEVGPGLAVGKAPDGSYDFAALRRCALQIKGTFADFADEIAVAISASADVPYEVVVKTIEALSTTDDGKDLFPAFSLGLGK